MRSNLVQGLALAIVGLDGEEREALADEILIRSGTLPDDLLHLLDAVGEIGESPEEQTQGPVRIH